MEDDTHHLQQELRARDRRISRLTDKVLGELIPFPVLKMLMRIMLNQVHSLEREIQRKDSTLSRFTDKQQGIPYHLWAQERKQLQV